MTDSIEVDPMVDTADDRVRVPIGASPREWLARDLEQRIMGGALHTGERLPGERILAEEHGVARNVVREAIRGLAEKGLIKVVPGSGAYVAATDPNEAARPLRRALWRSGVTPRQIVEARRTLEADAAALAALRRTPADVERLRSLLDRFEGASDSFERARHDIRFHHGVVRTAGNPVVETMFVAIAPLVASLMLRSVTDPATLARGAPFHGELLDAIVEGDPDGAHLAVHRHLAIGQHTYGDDYDRPLQPRGDVLGATGDGADDLQGLVARWTAQAP